MPKKTEVRMTTTVVAYTSFCDGQVTRFSSLRTSLRKRRARSMRPPAAPLTASRVVVVDVVVSFAAITSYVCRVATVTDVRLRTFARRLACPSLRLAGQEGIEP